MTLLVSTHGEPTAAVETFVTVYQAAAAAIDAYTAVQQEAKKLIGEVMGEVGRTKFVTRAGTVQVTAPTVIASYDAKALDELCRTDADVALILYIYRKEVERAGSLRITLPR